MSSENPTVNRCLSDKAFDRIDHAIGRPIFPLRDTFRNHFATPDGKLVAHFEASPYWKKTARSGDMAFYSVTAEGRQALASHLESIAMPWRAFHASFDGVSSIVPERTRAKARYAYWLMISDCCPDLTFGDFCRRVSVRNAL